MGRGRFHCFSIFDDCPTQPRTPHLSSLFTSKENIREKRVPEEGLGEAKCKESTKERKNSSTSC